MANYWQKRAELAARDETGVPFTSKSYPDWVFMVRRSHGDSIHYGRALVRYAARKDIADLIKRQSEPGYVPSEADQKLNHDMMRDVFAEACVANWKGVTAPDGGDFPRTPANARRLLAHFEDLYLELLAFAEKPENFTTVSADEVKAVVAGN